MITDEHPIITVLGPTATGKTHIAVRLAAELGGEIVSADSRQIYRRMDIGTGKDISEYRYNGQEIPYHLIDIEEPGVKYNVFRYQQEAFKAMRDIQSRGRQIVLCGGSGLYIEAVIQGYRFSFQDDGQILSDPVPSVLIGLRGERDLIRSRITSRLKARLEEGMVDEIRGLLDSGVPSEILLRYGLEYKFVTLYLLGEIDYEEMFEKLNVAIHQFSKRQMTWFRRMERLGMDIHWIDVALPEDDKMEAIYHIIKDCGGTSLPQTADH